MTPAGELNIIDRASSVVKLAIGEFLSPEKVESVLELCPGVRQVLVCTNSKGTAVIAIVVPNLTASEILESSDVWLARFRSRCKEAGLTSFECPQRVIVDPNPWTAESGLLLPNLKISRRSIKKHHETEIEAEFELPAHTQPTDADDNLSIMELVLEAIATAVGCDVSDISESVPLVEQGADSLTLVRLISELHQLGMRLASRQLLVTIPSRLTLAEMARASPITLALRFGEKVDRTSGTDGEPAPLVSLASRMISRTISTKPRGNALSLDGNAEEQTGPEDIARHIDVSVAAVREVMNSSISTNSSPSLSFSRPHIFVTGATGYFGSFLVACALKRDGGISATSTPIISCLVRADSIEVAHTRLRDSLVNTRELTSAEIDTAFQTQTLQVVVGDMSQPLYGLDLDEFQELAEKVDTIVNCAAAVKFFDAPYGYRILSNVNVRGTVEALKLANMAKSGRQARFIQISTMTVDLAAYDSANDRGSGNWPAISLMASNSGAYGLTKAVAEVVVRQAGNEMKVKPIIVRLPLMTWSESNGVANPTDWAVRLLETCRQMQMRPDSATVDAWTSPIAYIPVDKCASILLDHLQITRHPTNVQFKPPTVETIRFESESLTLNVKEVLEYESQPVHGKTAGLEMTSDHAFLTAISSTELPFAALAPSFTSANSRKSELRATLGVSRQKKVEPAAPAISPFKSSGLFGPAPSLADSTVARLRIMTSSMTWRTGLEKNKHAFYA